MILKIQSKIFDISQKYGRKIGLDLPYFVKNGFWMALRIAAKTFFGVILYMALARFVSQEIFGQYQFIISIFAIVYVFSHPGLNTSLLRSAARGYDGDYRLAVKKSFRTSFLGVPVILLLGAYYYFSGQRGLGISLMISSAFFPFFYAPNTWEWFLQGKHKFNVLMRYSAVQSFINVAATILVIFLKNGNLIWIMTVYLVSYVFFNGLYYLKSLKYIENNKKDPDFLSYGRFLTKINILSVISNNADKILVGMLLGPINLAIYTIISLIATKFKDIIKSFMAMFFPKMTTLKINFSEFMKLHKNKLVILLFSFLALSIVYYAAIPFVNKIMFTDKYFEFSNISRLFSITIFLSIPIGVLGYYINARKNEFAIMLTNPVFNIIRILLNIYFIWNFKLLGAAIAFNVSMILWVGLHLYGIFHEENSASGIKSK